MTALDNVGERKVFMETWCRFIDIKANRNASQSIFELVGSELAIEELSDRLNSTHDNLRASKSRIQIAWEHFPYKGYLAFIYLVVLMLSSFLTLLYGVWWVGLVGLLSGLLSIYLFTPSSIPSTRFKKDWIYTSYLKLRLKLWKIPPPAPDNDMLNPRCIYVPLNKHQAGNWGEWLSAVILPKLQSELGITDMKELDSTIKNAERSLNDFQTYSLWSDGVGGYFRNPPLWWYWLLGVVFLLCCIIGGLYHESRFAPLVSLSGVIACIGLIIRFVKSNIEPDIEANVNIVDVLCCLHRVMKKETIFFAVVANGNDFFNKMPVEYRRYFKFLINCRDISEDIDKPYNYLFNMDWLKYNDIKDSVRDPLADIIFNYIINKSSNTELEDDENTFEFLRLLHKTNNDNNNVLSNRSMLHLVHGQAVLLYQESDSEPLYIKFWGPTCSADISHLDLQAMELYTTQYKLLMGELKKRAAAGGESMRQIMMVRFFTNDNQYNTVTI